MGHILYEENTAIAIPITKYVSTPIRDVILVKSHVVSNGSVIGYLKHKTTVSLGHPFANEFTEFSSTY